MREKDSNRRGSTALAQMARRTARVVPMSRARCYFMMPEAPLAMHRSSFGCRRRGTPALRIATLLNSARVCSSRTAHPARIPRPMSSRARSVFVCGTANQDICIEADCVFPRGETFARCRPRAGLLPSLRLHHRWPFGVPVSAAVDDRGTILPPAWSASLSGPPRHAPHSKVIQRIHG